ncbi:MAG: methyltransferase domain-containing protein [Planctomycetota bacterium]|jgi:hypothetical protein
MPLARLSVPVEPREPPQATSAFLGDARTRIAQFIEGRGDRPIPAFVSCNFLLAHDALSTIATERLAPGTSFCEWGSGFGVVASLAAMLDFRACGIEIDGDLVEAARQLSTDHGIAVEFVEGSYTPPGTFTDEIDERTLDAELGFAPTAFDVVFAYPWPAEERVVFTLFDRYAAVGSLLVTYHGGADLRVHRRTE